MAALVQSFPTQQSSPPVSLMQSRPQSSTTTLQAGTPSQSAHPTQHHHLTPRNMGGYPNTNTGSNSSGSGGGGSGYRSGYTSAPVAPYAFTSTPGLSNTKPALASPKILERTPSTPAAGHLDSRNRYPASDSVSSSSSASSDPSFRNQQAQSAIIRSKEEHSDGRPNLRPISTISTNLSPPILSPTGRPSPDRYRRANNGRAGSNTGQVGSGSAQPSRPTAGAVAPIYTQPGRANSNPSLPPTVGNAGGVGKAAPFIGDYAGQLRSQSVDDIHTYRSPSSISNLQQMQNRRRSVGPDAFSPESFQNFVRNEMSASSRAALQLSRPESQVGASGPNSITQNTPRPGNRRTGSTDSSVSGNSSRPSSVITSPPPFMSLNIVLTGIAEQT